MNLLWKTHQQKIEIRGFDERPIDFAWFMKSLSSASTIYPVFNDENSFLFESLMEWICDDFVDKVSVEQLRLFKKYASLQVYGVKKSILSAICFFLFYWH